MGRTTHVVSCYIAIKKTEIFKNFPEFLENFIQFFGNYVAKSN